MRPKKGGPRPELNAIRLGLLIRLCPSEIAAVVTLWAAWLGLFLGWRATGLAAVTSSVLVTAGWWWWFTRDATVDRLNHRAIHDRWARICVRHGLFSISPHLGRTMIPQLANVTDERGTIRADILLPPYVPWKAIKANEDDLEAGYGRGKLRTLEIIEDDDHRTLRLVIKRSVAFDRHTTTPFPYRPGQGIAVKETGEPVHIAFGVDPDNILVAGIKGSGKSSYLNAIIAEAVCSDLNVRLVGVDLKKVELGPWEPAFDRLARTAEEATEVLHWVSAEIERRRDRLDELGLRKWEPGCGFDPLMLVVDELRETLRDWPDEDPRSGDARRSAIESIAALGRFVGVQGAFATQNPLASRVGEIRQNCDHTIACRVRTETESYVALGDLGRKLRPDKITKDLRGVAWVVGDDLPYRARAVWLENEDVARLAAKAAR